VRCEWQMEKTGVEGVLEKRSQEAACRRVGVSACRRVGEWANGRVGDGAKRRLIIVRRLADDRRVAVRGGPASHVYPLALCRHQGEKIRPENNWDQNR
jgi:hypothetical protein